MTAVSLPPAQLWVSCSLFLSFSFLLCRADGERSTWYRALSNCEVPLFVPKNILLLSPLNVFYVLAIKCKVEII